MGHLSTISFPGLGIGEFTVDAVAISFKIGNFPVTIMWYGIIICIGIFAGFGYFAYRAKRMGLSSDSILDITLVTVLVAIAGARLYFVIFFGGYLETGGTFWQNLGGTLYNIIAIWNGGLAIYGGIIGGALAVFLLSKYKKIGFFQLADAIMPGVMLGQLIGRWGNFCNGEAFGSETMLPWRMGLNNINTGYQTLYVHPTFLYESLWNLVGFILINAFYKKRKYHGEVTMWYFAWYGLGRGFIELLRTDSLMLGSVRISSLLSFVLVAIIVPLFFILRRRYNKLCAEGHFTAGVFATIPALLHRYDMTETDVESEEAPADLKSENLQLSESEIQTDSLEKTDSPVAEEEKTNTNQVKDERADAASELTEQTEETENDGENH